MSTIKYHLQIKHDLIGKIFYLKVLGGNAELHYKRIGDEYLDIQSTTVPVESRKFGIGTMLIERAISFAKEQQLKIKATCEFAASYFKDHPEYDHLLV